MYEAEQWPKSETLPTPKKMCNVTDRKPQTLGCGHPVFLDAMASLHAMLFWVGDTDFYLFRTEIQTLAILTLETSDQRGYLWWEPRLPMFRLLALHNAETNIEDKRIAIKKGIFAYLQYVTDLGKSEQMQPGDKYIFLYKIKYYIYVTLSQ